VAEITTAESTAAPGGKGGVITAVYSGEELEDEIGWIFAVTGEITKDVENEEHEALADTGACRSVCPLDFATHVTMTPAPTELKLNTASGKKLKIFGIRVVKVRLTTDQGNYVFARLTFVVTEVRTPILALATLCDNGASFNLKSGIATIEKDGRTITVRRRGNLYFVPFVFAFMTANPVMIGQVESGGATGSSSAASASAVPVVAQSLPQPQLPARRRWKPMP
jgi:hypothetical protein